MFFEKYSERASGARVDFLKVEGVFRKMTADRPIPIERPRKAGDVACCLAVVWAQVSYRKMETFVLIQPVRLLVNDRKFLAGNSVFLSHQTSQQ